jgi:hypothetical protein
VLSAPIAIESSIDKAYRETVVVATYPVDDLQRDITRKGVAQALLQ